MYYGIIGTSIWQQNMPLMERLTIDRETRSEVLRKFKEQLELDELIYLATCNRVEFLYATADESRTPGQILHRLIDFFFLNGSRLSFFPNDFYCYEGREALTYLFRTVSSLESLVVGETQITGQFKQAWQEAKEQKLCSKTLSDLSREALLVARRVKRETSIGEGALSMASLASAVLSKHLCDIENPRVVISGAGSMTVKMAHYLDENISASLLFVNRTLIKAQKLADRFGGDAMTLDAFKTLPGRVDAIVSATAAPDAVFDEMFMSQLIEQNKQIVCIDLAIPRDFSESFDLHPKILFFDIPGLKAQGNQSLRKKFVQTEKANRIIREEVNNYLSHCVEITLKPIFSESYRISLELAEQALRDLFNKRIKNLDSVQQEDVLRLVTKLIGRSTFQPIRTLSDHLVDKELDLTTISHLWTSKEAI